MQDSVIVKNVTKTFNINKTKGIGNLLKHFRTSKQKNFYLKALDGISFSVPTGEVLGIIGLNGSGKSTLLRTVAGMYKPDFGSVTINGKLSPLLQIGIGFHGDLTAKENVVMNGMLLGITKNEMKKKVNDIIDYAELNDFENTKLKLFSSGMRARLAFSTLIQVDSEIILLDEILAVGDAKFSEKSQDAIRSFTKNGKTILIASHNMKMISDLSDRVLFLDHGKIMKLGKPNEVIHSYNEMIIKQKNLESQ